MTKPEAQALRFAEEVLGLAMHIVSTAAVQITDKGALDPKIIGLALLSRTISNFQGAMIMARDGLIVEARTLTRSCIENLLWAGALRERGTEFVKCMLNDEAANSLALGELILKWRDPKSVKNESEAILQTDLRNLRSHFPKAKKLHANRTAEEGVAEQRYMAFSVLSRDSVHPSISALGRHVRSEDEPDGRYLTVDIVPPVKSEERLATVDYACDALLGVCVAVNELLGGTEMSDALRKLPEQFLAQGRHSYHPSGSGAEITP